MLKIADGTSISSKKVKAILQDPQKTAEAIKLVYVQDTKPGIIRKKIGNNFSYYLGKKKLKDKTTLERINKLVIPPAWENVWICASENGHLQATGIDTQGRKQYRYHQLWSSFRNQTKFYRLYEFGKAIPAVRGQLKKDLAKNGLPPEKVLATVISLMEQTSIRVGNSAYEKRYGSYGLTTLKDKHIKINNDKLQFVFKGKKGVYHNIHIQSKKLARIVKQCRDIPGKELFQYYDNEGNHHAIDSGMVNDYLKSITGQDFTTKDFRTWMGSIQAIAEFKSTSELKNNDGTTTQSAIKKNIVNVLDKVAACLGNTRTVCKKYYVHPVILALYEGNKLQAYLHSKNIKPAIKKLTLTDNEKLLLHILERETG